MAATKRSRHQREKDREEISRLYLSGKTQNEIAEIMAISQPQVSYDLRAVQKTWEEARHRSLDEVRAAELARLDFVYAEAMAAWELSKRDAVTTTATQTITRNRDGNPRFLMVAMEAIHRCCELTGLLAGRGSETLRILATGCGIIIEREAANSDSK